MRGAGQLRGSSLDTLRRFWSTEGGSELEICIRKGFASSPHLYIEGIVIVVQVHRHVRSENHVAVVLRTLQGFCRVWLCHPGGGDVVRGPLDVDVSWPKKLLFRNLTPIARRAVGRKKGASIQ